MPTRPLALPLAVVLLWLGTTVLLLPHGSRPVAHAAGAGARISQIYGGGGNKGAVWRADFIELFNAGPLPQDLSGWTVEYAPATGDRWRQVDLTGIALEPYRYLLIQLAEGKSGDGEPLPTPDLSGTVNLNAREGKVRLVDPNGVVVDLVGYGGADRFEGPSPVPALSAGTSARRLDGGCRDTDANGADFEVVPPTPRNSQSPENSCSPPATPTDTPTLPPPPVTAPPTATPSPTTTPTPSPTPPPPASPTPTPSGETFQGQIWLSELLIDPNAVPDAAGEWIELYNSGPNPVNLREWTLADLDKDAHPISTDLWIHPGTFLLLGRNPDPNLNGGVSLHYTYSGLALANSQDELLLIAPDGTTVDQLAWGGDSPLKPIPGASLVRTQFHPQAPWVHASSPWPGSAGDLGSPGAPYQPPTSTPAPTSTPSPTPTPTPSATPPPPASPTTPSPTPTSTPTPIQTPPSTPVPSPSASATPTSSPLPGRWPVAPSRSPLRIEAVHFRGSLEEYVVLANIGAVPRDLTGWRIGDAQVPGAREGIYALPDGWVLAPGGRLVLARRGDAFHARWGQPPDLQFEASDSPVPVLARVGALATGTWALNDSGDEVLLLDPQGRLADAVAYGDGDSQALGLDAGLPLRRDLSLHRVPGFPYPEVRDPRLGFLWAPPSPFHAPELPRAQAPYQMALPLGRVAIWGSLGVAHTLTGPEGMVPPQVALWAAAAQGLAFAGLLDAEGAFNGLASGPVVPLPAWRWSDGEQAALVLGPRFPALTLEELLAGLPLHGGQAFWSQGTPPVHAQVRGVVLQIADLGAILRALEPHPAPLLPAGAGQPALPWHVPPQPLFTGLAVSIPDDPGIRDALQAARGWVTTRPGLALVLRAQAPNGTVWMGGMAEPANTLWLRVDYRDLQGQPGGLTLWRNGQPVAQHPASPGTGSWEVPVPGIPGSRFVATATQTDGDLAVTAALAVASRPQDTLRLNELLPIPRQDHNGDGRVDAGDEYVELYQPAEYPLSLEGWSLRDAQGNRYRFPATAFVAGQGYYLVWGGESRFGLNDRNEEIQLLDPADRVVDRVAWQEAPGPGRALGRLAGSTDWLPLHPSPGEPNRSDPGPGGSGQPSEPPGESPSPTPEPTPNPPWGSGAAPGTPGGEAVGPLGSVAAAKLRPQGEWVEIRARVVAPPGLYNSAIYVADPAPDPNPHMAWIGIQVYLRRGRFPPLEEGDRVLIRGRVHSFRGEEELLVERPEDIWRIGPATPLVPLPVEPEQVGESLEGRLVTLEGVVVGWRGRSFFLAAAENPEGPSTEIHVRSSLSWRRPFVERGQRWRVTGVVSQFDRRPPWNEGYRVLVRYPSDLTLLDENGP